MYSLVEPLRRAALIRQLSSAEIRCADALTLQRCVVIDGRKIFGRAESGRLVWSEPDGHIKAFVPNVALNGKGMPHAQLSAELAGLLRLGEHKKELIMMILTSSDTDEIEDELERVGYGGGSDAGSEDSEGSDDDGFDFTSFTPLSHEYDTVAPALGHHARAGVQGESAPGDVHVNGRQKRRNRKAPRVVQSDSLPNAFVNLDDIVNAAANFDLGQIDVLFRPRSSSRPFAGFHPISNSSSRPSDDRTFHMSSLQATLDGMDGPAMATDIAFKSDFSPAVAWTGTLDFQHAIGRAGEVFVSVTHRAECGRQLTLGRYTSSSRTSSVLPVNVGRVTSASVTMAYRPSTKTRRTPTSLSASPARCRRFASGSLATLMALPSGRKGPQRPTTSK